MMQPPTTMMKIVAFLSSSEFDELHYPKNREETLKPSSLPSKQHLVVDIHSTLTICKERQRKVNL